MPLNFFQRRRILKGANYMVMHPVRVHDHTIDASGRVTLIVPKFKNKKWASFVIPPRRSKHFRIHLDEYGSTTWLAIDGKRTVEEICRYLGEQYGEKIDPVEKRVTKFMTQLYDQRYISFTELTRAE